MDGLHVGARHSAADYQLTNHESQHLALLMKGHNFFVAISNPSDKSLLHLEKWTLDPRKYPDLTNGVLDQLFRSQPILQQTYQSHTIGCWSPWFTFVPDAFANGDYNAFLGWQLGDAVDHPMVQTAIPEVEAQLEYGIEPGVLEWATKHFGEESVTHAAKPLIAYFSRLNAFNGKTKVYAYVTDRLLEIIVFDKNRFHLYNAYSFQQPEDFLYFVTLVFDQLQLDPEEDLLVLSGELAQDSRLYALLYRYFRNLQFTAKPEDVKLAPGLEGLDNHFYLHVMTLL